MNISIFEQWWQAIQPAVQANTLNAWQFIYKEIYLNVIKDNRWQQYLKGLGVTLEVSFYAILVGLALVYLAINNARRAAARKRAMRRRRQQREARMKSRRGC